MCFAVLLLKSVLMGSEVLNGQPDLRRSGFRTTATSSPQLDVANKFLQMKYHSEGEFLPERWDFSAKSEFVIDKAWKNIGQVTNDDSDPETDGSDDNEDAEERAVSSLACDAIVMSEPFRMAAVGPGSGPGVRRYLGVVKPAILFECMLKWCAQCNLLPAPSFTTFLSELRQARPWIRFRCLDHNSS